MTTFLAKQSSLDDAGILPRQVWRPHLDKASSSAKPTVTPFAEADGLATSCNLHQPALLCYDCCHITWYTMWYVSCGM